MLNFKKIFPLFLIMTMFLCGCASTNNSSNAVMISATEKINTIENKLHESIKNDKEDLLLNANWTIYYDGKVVYYEEYSVSGNKNETSYVLDSKDFKEIKKLFKNEGISSNNIKRDGAFYWDISFYSKNGSLKKHHDGYIYNKENLLKVEEILKSEKY